MGAMIIPVIAALTLGSTFDAWKYKKTTGGELFDPTTLRKNVQRIALSSTNSQYKLVETSAQARDFLDVGGELALRIKNGDVKVEGSGTYLTDKANRQNFVELLIRVQHETVTETIPSHLAVSSDWLSRKNAGTHYVRSITYGGELVASLRLTAGNTEEREIIKAAVSANLQLVGSFDGNATGNFEKLRRDLAGMYNAEIKLMSTTLPTSPPQDVEDLVKFVESYPEQIIKINNGLGNPLKAELYPLSSIVSDYSTYFSNSAFTNQLDDVDAKYDDVRTTLSAFHEWNRKRDSTMDTLETEDKLGEFYSEISKTQKAFSLAIAKLDDSNERLLSHFDKAFELYGTGGNNIPHRFFRWFWRLRNEVAKEPIVWTRAPGSGVTYSAWGSKECSQNAETQLLYRGYASGAPASAWNGARDYLCLPEDVPKLITSTPRGSNPVYEHLLGFHSLRNADEVKYIICATCFVPDTINIKIFAAMTTCPEGWSLQYAGHLMADYSSVIDRNFMCVSKDANSTAKDFLNSKFVGKLNAVWMDCTTCNGEKIVPCIVCTK